MMCETQDFKTRGEGTHTSPGMLVDVISCNIAQLLEAILQGCDAIPSLIH
jgi:hypothetical protein